MSDIRHALIDRIEAFQTEINALQAAIDFIVDERASINLEESMPDVANTLKDLAGKVALRRRKLAEAQYALVQLGRD